MQQSEAPLTSKTLANRRWLAKNPGYNRQWYAAHPGYSCWVGMIQRCTNPKQPNWARYGGRGITVCAEWVASYEAFMEHIGPRPGPDSSIDRIDNDGNYEPGNVRWATRSEQQRNKGTKVPRWVAERIVRERSERRTWEAIARGLNADGVPTPNGKTWYGVTAKLAADRIS